MTSKKPSKSKELSSKEAGELLGYTHDYISRLCRTGEMTGIKKGREWFVLEEELEAFKKRHEVVLQQKKKNLSKKLSKIRKEHEAKKRQVKLSQKPNNTKQSNSTNTGSKKLNIESDSHVVKFHIPKRIMAACVFVLLLGIMSWLSSIETSRPDIINTSSENMSASAHAFSTTQIVSSGVSDYVQEIKNISTQTLGVWSTIGNAYLFLYVMQGEAIYNAFGDLAYAGEVVLDGYQILGYSFIIGFQNLFEYTASLFNSGADFSKKKLNSFTYNVKEGFVYTSQTLSSAVYTYGFVYVVEGFDILIQNIGSNMYAMNSVFQSTSSLMLGNVGGAFQFNIFKKEPSEVIKIEN